MIKVRERSLTRFRRISSWIATACGAVLLGLCACSRQGTEARPTEAKPKDTLFKTRFENESQFIVETIISDLAEQLYFAKHHQLPDRKHFSVRATEKPDCPFGMPEYDLCVTIDAGPPVLLGLNVDQPIWSPELYRPVANAIGRQVGLQTAGHTASEKTDLLEALIDGAPGTIAKEDRKLSSALEADFTNPSLHEQAALLLGAFALREHAGNFNDVRLPLCRMTAHLAVAQCLATGGDRGINGQIADVMLMTLMNNRVLGLSRLGSIKNSDKPVMSWLGVLRTRLTGDYRALPPLILASPIERTVWFAAYSQHGSSAKAWGSLPEIKGQTIDACRMAMDGGYSVETGNELLRLALPLEMAEAGGVYEAYHGRPLKQEQSVMALNAVPERALVSGSGSGPQVSVIGWGQWARFLQAHLCQAIMQVFNVYRWKQGLNEDAGAFMDEMDPLFGGLRLYPFVRVISCLDAESYHKSLDAGARLVGSEPHLVPSSCWNYLWCRVPFAQTYTPVPFERQGQWFKHNPPPGTAFEPRARLAQSNLADRPDAQERLARIRELAPYDLEIIGSIIKEAHTNDLTYDVATNLYAPVLSFSSYAMQAVASSAMNDPGRVEFWMAKAADLDPECYVTLGDYFVSRKEDDKAAGYYDKGEPTEVDSVVLAARAQWRVKYYLGKGQKERARRVADAAAAVNSARGLQAKGEYHEAVKEYATAFEWYAKVEERYDDPEPLLGFCVRCRTLSKDPRFEQAIAQRIKDRFPTGMEKATLGQLSGEPSDGVFVGQENNLIQQAGLKRGDVIVVINGVRVHNLRQYALVRALRSSPTLDLVAWQGERYIEVKASPPEGRFGVAFTDYPPTRL